MILRAALVASLPPLALMACSSQPPQTSVRQTQCSICQSSQLTFSLDDGNGRFKGMSHSGTTLVLRNAGTTACTIPALPQPRFTNADGRSLDITAQDSADPLGGPLSPPMLAPGASVASDMRWVSGNVYDNGHCESPAVIVLAIGKQTVSTDFAGHLCGPGGKPSTYTLTPFRSTPTAAHARTANTLIYTCEDGRTVQVAYPDARTAVLTLDGQTHRLHTAISATERAMWASIGNGGRRGCTRLGLRHSNRAKPSRRPAVCHAPRHEAWQHLSTPLTAGAVEFNHRLASGVTRLGLLQGIQRLSKQIHVLEKNPSTPLDHGRRQISDDLPGILVVLQV